VLERLARELAALRAVVSVMQVQPGVHERLHPLSKRYPHGQGFFFIGRDLFYPSYDDSLLNYMTDLAHRCPRS
jgi:hypothetical protein